MNILNINRYLCRLRGKADIKTDKILYCSDGHGFYLVDSYDKLVFFKVEGENNVSFHPTYLHSKSSRRPFPGDILVSDYNEYVSDNVKSDVLSHLKVLYQ